MIKRMEIQLEAFKGWGRGNRMIVCKKLFLYLGMIRYKLFAYTAVFWGCERLLCV